MTTKGPDAYRTISEAAAELDLPTHVLRFWESRFSQIKPVKRAGGRRLYRPSDIDLLRGIRALLYDQGYTIKGAQKYLRENGVAAVALPEGIEATPVTSLPLAEKIVPTQHQDISTDTGEPKTQNLEAIISKLEQAKQEIDNLLRSRSSAA